MDIKEDRPAYVTFERRAKEDRNASIEAGHYVSKDVDVAIITPPYSKDRIEQEVPDWLASLEANVAAQRLPGAWRDKYKAAYQAWKDGQEIPLDGVPIKGWAILSPAQQSNLIAIGVKTVEDLAAINDEGMRRYGMGALDLKNKASAWLNSAKDSGKVAQENAALKSRVDALDAQVQELMEANKRLLAQLDGGKQKKAA